jgi:hypothetical protein
MESFKNTIIILLLVSGLLIPAVQAKSPSLLLQEGLYAEETEGDLEKAISLYEQVLEQYKDVERLAARATYQLGMCYLKKGEKEKAAEYFQEAADYFPEQTSVVEKARVQLDKIRPPSPTPESHLPFEVYDYIVWQHFAAGKKANELGISSNTHIYGIDDMFNKHHGGYIDVFNMGQDTWTEPRKIAQFTCNNTNLDLYNEQFEKQQFEWKEVKSAYGKRCQLIWTPDRPVKPNEFRVFGYRHKEVTRLPATSKGHQLIMQNHYGSEVIENFFLVLPRNLKIVEKTSEITSHQQLGFFDIYLFQRHMHGENNRVTVTIDKTEPVAVDSPTVVETSPKNFANDISPETARITITFDKEMFTHGYSWCRNMHPYPEVAGSPRFGNGNLSCTLPVKLQPGQYYRIGINTPPYQGFRSAEGAIAHEYILVFATADENGNPTPIPQSIIAEANRVNVNMHSSSKAMMTQEMHNIIDANGLIHFKSPNRISNNNSEPITTTGFINSDFVSLTKMYEEDGTAIPFETTHEGNIYRYRITFNKPIMPGESMVYYTEGTIRGLIRPVPGSKDVFRYFMVHSPRAGQPVLRIETFLLPEDTVFISTSTPDIQKTEKDGRIELHVEKVVPANGSIATEFQYKLSASSEPLKLEPAPWVDGEVMEVRLKRPAGGEYGTIIYSAQSNTLNGNDTWQIISHMYVTEGSISQYTFVEAEAESFAPIYGQTTNWMGDFVAEYNNGNVKLTVGAEGKESARDVSVQGIAYDNEQALYLIRRMPLAENYEGSFPIFSVQGGATIECRIKVLGTEDITVEAGTFTCYKTDLSIYTGGVKTLQHTLWFSADEDKYLVKYDVGGTATMELAKVWQKDKDKPITFENKEPHFSVTMPADWRFYSYASSGPQFSLQLIPPEVKAWAVLVWQKRGTDPDSASAMTIAKADCGELKGFFENYTTDEASWKEYKINGLEAARYVATYQKKGSPLRKYTKPKQMVEYRTYIVDQSSVYWFVFRVEKDQFEDNKTELDSIIKSFKINAN